MKKIQEYDIIEKASVIKSLVEDEHDRTGGIFRLAPAWVGRPGIIIPGRRIKLNDIYISKELAVNERWLASVTYADNGVYNPVCPPDHGYSYLLIGGSRICLKDALDECGDLLLGKGKKWDVLPKFFDNWHRIPNHMHPCDDHCAPGLVGKPESYHFPVELNMNRNASPATPIGVDPCYTDGQIMGYFRQYMSGDNRLTDLGNTVNILPGTGYHMPPCTLHAPGSLVTYELQRASDVSCIPESRVNDMVMPSDMLDRDLPVKVDKDGFEKVCEHMLSMVRCKNSGNTDSFRREYFRPPVKLFADENGSQRYVIYRTGRMSEERCQDLYSAKSTLVNSGMELTLRENAAFGAIVLRGHGCLRVEGKQPVAIESVSMYPGRDNVGGDEVFVAAGAAAAFKAECRSMETLSFYSHFASCSNSESAELRPGEHYAFEV